MAVKIFCNACKGFIKNATKNDLSSLSGEEICPDCQTRVSDTLGSLDKAARRAVVQIESQRDQFKAKLERMYKKVIKPDDD